jgi:transposase
MQLIQDIVYRLRQGQSERAIARDLGHSRMTVRRYHELAREKGFLEPETPLPAPDLLLAQLGPPAPPPRCPSSVEPYQALIEEWLRLGVEQSAMHQRLVQHHGYPGSYSSVRRFVRHLRPPSPQATVRLETPPGRQAQVDFTAVGKLKDPATDKLRPAYAFLMTLSYSRHQYVEFVFDQSLPTWIGCHRRAFESFGGTPQEIVLDNLKAGVLQHALEDPVFSTPYRQMAQHYGFLLHPCRPRTPQHKGKVENGVRYLQRNFLAGATFGDLADANQRVRVWVREVAGVRDHGTTHEAPLARFQREREALAPLPPEPFQLEAVRAVRVHRDCHVVLEGSFYSVPHALVGQTLEAHLYEHTLQLYRGTQLVVTHPRAQSRGERFTRLEHYPQEKALYLERTPEVCQERAQQVGESCHLLVLYLLVQSSADNLRAVQSLVGLESQVGRERLEAACARALHYGDPRYRRVKAILAAGLESAPLTEEGETFAPSPPRTYAHARTPEEFFGSEASSC